MAYTLNGKTWEYVDDGKVFPANTDRNTKVRVQFDEPVYARTIRIYPQTWQKHITLRFDVIHVDLSY